MIENSSIDDLEIKKFNKTLDEWWDVNGEFKMLHDITPIRMSYITSKLKQHFNITDFNKSDTKLDIVDIGCGGGLVTVPLAKLGLNTSGVDASLQNIQAAMAYANRNNLQINYINSTAEDLAKENKKYDCVLCLEVIEHVANVEEFIHNLTKLLKPGGILILSTINRNIKSYMLAIFMAEYILGWVHKNTHDYSKFLKPSELNSILLTNNMKITELKGLTFNLLDQSWRLSSDIDVNYFACSTL